MKQAPPYIFGFDGPDQRIPLDTSRGSPYFIAKALAEALELKFKVRRRLV